MMTLTRRSLSLGLLATLMVMLLAFGITQIAQATHTVFWNCSPSTVAAADTPVPMTCSGPAILFPTDSGPVEICSFSGLYNATADGSNIKVAFLTDADEIASAAGFIGDFAGDVEAYIRGIAVPCGGSSYDPFAPGIWLMALCEPLDGFSPDDWISVDTDALNGALPPTLYVAAGPDGPWHATEFLFPPYIMSKAQVEALTAWMGLSDYHDLWLKPSEAGTPANLGSMIADREAHMAELCGD